MAARMWSQGLFGFVFDKGFDAYKNRDYGHADLIYRSLLFAQSFGCRTAEIGKAYFMLGELHLEQLHYEKAVTAYKNALMVFQSLDHTDAVRIESAIALQQLSKIYALQGEFAHSCYLTDQAQRLTIRIRSELEKSFNSPCSVQAIKEQTPAKRGLFEVFSATLLPVARFQMRFF